jgi:hypothetical protein
MNQPQAAAHCDTLDGPVVKAAQRALATGDVKLALPWVQKEDELEIERAFRRTLAVRNLSPAAQELADRYFFETLVRVHRAGEGAPFTGLKPPGTGITPAIGGADKALKTGDVSLLLKELNRQVTDGIRARFRNVAEKRNFKANDVAAGREYVRAYVEYLHYIERIHAAAGESAQHHSKAGTAAHAEPESHGDAPAKTHVH